MARVEHRKARKAYPQQGIEAGDMYYFAQIKTGPRSSRTIRSKNPIPRSQLTTSSFKSQLYDIEDNSFDGIETADELRDVAEQVRALGEEAQESFDNMPEGLQQGDTGQLLEERVNGCDSWASDIESAADELESELADFDRMVEAFPAYLEEKEAYDKARAEFDDLDEEEQAAVSEPDEPDQPELPEGLNEDEIDDEDRIREERQEIITRFVDEAQNANPGLD